MTNFARWASRDFAPWRMVAPSSTTSRASSRKMPWMRACRRARTLPQMTRYIAYVASVIAALLCIWGRRFDQQWRWGVVVFVGLALLGTWDLLQRKSALRRNYPLLAHFRYGLESIGPEIRQYFIQSDLEEVPFSREQRSLVYQRAKGVMDVVPFG